jgi:hypothetical protein
MKYLTRNNRVVNLPQTDLNLALLDANIILPFVEPVKPPAAPASVWSVGEGNGENPDIRIAVFCATCGARDGIFAQPERYRFWHCGIRGGEPVPPEIIQRFNESKK